MKRLTTRVLKISLVIFLLAFLLLSLIRVMPETQIHSAEYDRNLPPSVKKEILCDVYHSILDCRGLASLASRIPYLESSSYTFRKNVLSFSASFKDSGFLLSDGSRAAFCESEAASEISINDLPSLEKRYLIIQTSPSLFSYLCAFPSSSLYRFVFSLFQQSGQITEEESLISSIDLVNNKNRDSIVLCLHSESRGLHLYIRDQISSDRLKNVLSLALSDKESAPVLGQVAKSYELEDNVLYRIEE